VRIIAGLVKGKKLASFHGQDIRPTPDRVREAVFNFLFSRIGSLEGKAVLDLFAGTGAMGLEALSRGAGRAVFVDEGEQAAKIILLNIRNCRLQEKAKFMRLRVPENLPRLVPESPFDLVFLDPPYGEGLVEETIAVLSNVNILTPGAIVCAETGGREEVPAVIGDYHRLEKRTYGRTAVHVFSHSMQGV
jgi:16S rRNA (guanine966-N2)-methyltransferase